MKKTSLNRLLVLVILLLSSIVTSWAGGGGGTTYYYAKVTAHVATGEGTVYVNADGNYSDDATGYGATSTGGNATPTSGGAVDVYMFAKPNEGYECVGWSTSATATSYESTSAQYTKSVIAATNGGEDRATTYDMYAYFKALPVFWFSAAASATLSGETATVDYKASDYGEHWNSASGTTLAKFTATRNTGYVFDGWSKTATGPIVSTDNPYYIQLESSSSTQAGATTVTYYARYSERIAPPTIAFSETATGFSVTLSHSLSDVIIYYSTDGSIPSATNGTQYGGSPFSVTSDLTTVKAVAVRNDVTSDVASTQLIRQTGTVGNSVILNDYEDHTWTYYAGVPATVDGGNYNTSYAGKIYSPNPRNVKITYNGVNDVTGSTNTVKVSASESETSFVYYKTLEESATSGQYSYQVISNPFSVRPSTGSGSSKVYYGFNGWKIVSGGEYIDGYSNGQTLPLDAKITFVSLPYPSVNCTSAEIVFQTTWTQATVRTSAPGTSDFTSGTYETNFWVLNGNQTSDVTLSKNMTISAQYPDGTQSGNYGFSSGITVSNTFAGTVKLEHLNLTGSSGINAGGRNLTIGRGIGGTSTRTIFGCNTQNTDVNQLLKVESGTYNAYYGYGYTTQYVLFVPVNTGIAPKSIVSQHTVFGNDYDRANSANTNLTISNNVYALYSSGSIGITDPTKLVTHITVKSGKFISDATTTNATFNNSFYMWDYSQDNNGLRILDIEGGEFGHIAGGANSTSSSDDVNKVINLKIRMRGGTVNGSIFGGAAQYNASGSKQFVFTGGTVKGWIAGGSNGYESADAGSVTGSSYVYIGGNTQVNSNGDNTARNAGVGGTVYGAGCGQSATATSGRVALGTNVVVADNAYVERGVYGGGSFGYCPTDKTTNIYITGGEVGGNAGAISRSTSQVYAYSSYITGGVYGGACQNNGGAVNIYMTGGLVNGGLYGGSNVSGMINQNVKMVVTDGQVGTSSQPANVHGGGYGPDTDVKGAVTVTLGESGATEGATIYGGTYGGSALGTISSTSTINVNAGTFKGGIYGGGLGNETTSADVAGKSTVNMTGGVAEGGVYGGGNINSTVGGNVEMHIDGGQIGLDADHTANIHGGGYGSKTVVAGNVDVTLGVATEDDEAKGATIYGNVYGGSALGKVNGSGDGTSINTGAHTNVTMNLGSVNGSIFGGGMGELSGTGRSATAVAGEGVVNGQINVAINGTDATIVTDDVRDYAVDGVFGGCDMVAYAGTPVVVINNCATSIDYVYGGGNAAAVSGTDVTINGGDINWAFGGGNGEDEAKPGADVNGDVSLTITGGTVNNIFGGSNTLGNITGKCDVIVEEGEDVEGHCPIAVGELYGGGNKAELYVAPNLDIRCLRGKLDAIYGGAKAADVHSDINLVIKSGQYGKVFGGNNQSGTIYGSIKVTVEETGCEPIVIGELYGCGNMAAYDKANDPDTPQDPQVNIISCTSIGAIYGGGLGETAVVTGNPVVSIQQEVGDHATAVDADGDGEADNKADAIGVIGDVFGGGNAAKVVGSTQVKIGTDIEVKGADGAIYKDNDNKAIPASANIRGNVYGGGNKAEVTGDTKVIVGPTKN